MPQIQPKTKHTAKDSVFTRLFREPENTLKLYQAIHPEDTTVTEADCELTTLETILMAGQYNDLGMLVRDRLILLMEAQSTYQYLTAGIYESYNLTAPTLYGMGFLAPVFCKEGSASSE